MTADWLFVQSLKHEDAENIGYVIPTPVIDHFINDYARNGQYTAFPALGVEWQKMESPFMRKALGMKVQHAVYLVPLRSIKERQFKFVHSTLVSQRDCLRKRPVFIVADQSSTCSCLLDVFCGGTLSPGLCCEPKTQLQK